MKTPILRFIRVLSLVLSLIVLASGSNDLYGQSITRSEANKQARLFRGEAGFDRINFNKGALQGILGDAAAIKFYNGMPNGERRNAVLMAIGLDGNGNEIGDSFLQSNSSGQVIKLSRSIKDIQVANAESNLRISAFSTSFGKEDLQALLNAAGVDGIDFLPSKKDDGTGTEVMTLTASPSGSSPEVRQMDARMSPCPPECFDREN